MNRNYISVMANRAKTPLQVSTMYNHCRSEKNRNTGNTLVLRSYTYRTAEGPLFGHFRLLFEVGSLILMAFYMFEASA